MDTKKQWQTKRKWISILLFCMSYNKTKAGFIPSAAPGQWQKHYFFTKCVKILNFL